MVLLHSCAKRASLGPINPKWKDLGWDDQWEIKQVFYFVSCFHVEDWKVSSNLVEPPEGKWSWKQGGRGCCGGSRVKVTKGLHGKSPAVCLCLNISSALCLRLVQPVLEPGEAWLFPWSQNQLPAPLRDWIVESLGPHGMRIGSKSITAPVWVTFCCFFPWKSRVGWRRPWCGVRQDMDANWTWAARLVAQSAERGLGGSLEELPSFLLWAGDFQLQISRGFLLIFHGWVCSRSHSEFTFPWVQVGQNKPFVHPGRSGKHWADTTQANSAFSA